MEINTKYFGNMEIGEEDTVVFPDPLAGFDGMDQYVLVRFFDDDDSMLCLQSVQDSDLAFIVLNPFYIDPDYAPRLTDEDLCDLESDKDNPLAFYAISVVPEDFKQTTVNLKCPVAVNPKKRLAKQIIMDDDRYSMHTPLSGGQKEG